MRQLTVLESRLLRDLGVRHGFSLRKGGVSTGPYASLNLGGAVGDQPAHVSENLSRFACVLGLPGEALRTATQVHGDRVLFARTGEPLSDEAGVPAASVEADALVASGGACVGVRTADCVPVLLFDPRSGAAAAVHAGWRGTWARIVVRAVEAMARVHGSRPRDLQAAIGPAIGPCCYEVGEELAARFEGDPSFGRAVTDRTGAAPRLDLWRSNRQLLESAGLSSEGIDELRACTACDPARFFSHRRDAGRTGRHLAAIQSIL